MSGARQAQSLEPTDQDGAFEIAGVRPGSYMLYAAAEGSLLEIGHDVDVADKDVTGVLVELGTGVTVSGRVDPAAVASVHLVLDADVGLSNMFDVMKAEMCRSESDAQGAFTLNHVPPGKFRVVAQTKDGRTGAMSIALANVDAAGIVIKLEPRASISGRVVDRAGKAVSGAIVEAESTEEHTTRSSIAVVREDAKTAVDGTFKIVGLAEGTYKIRTRDVVERGFLGDRGADVDGDTTAKRHATVKLAAGTEKTDVTLVVESRDGTIRGVVVDGDGTPVADAWVSAWVSDSEPVLTNDQGRFTIARLAKASYTLVAEGPRGSSRGEKKEVKVGDTVTIQLASLGAIVVSVVQGGKPVTSYDVECSSAVGGIERHANTVDGSYQLGALAPGDYTCKVRAATGTAEGKVTVPPGPVKLALTLAPWGSVTGVVVSVLTGKPVPNLAVVTAIEDNPTGLFDVMTGRAPKTDANGRFVLERVAPKGVAAKGRIVFAAKDAAMSWTESHEYVAMEGQRVDLGTIKVVPPRSGAAGTFGLATEVDGDALKVINIKDGGPAAQAGVVVGDTITALAAQPVKTLTAAVAQKLLASGSVGVGETMSLTLARGPTVALTSMSW